VCADIMRTTIITSLAVAAFLTSAAAVSARPTIDELKSRVVLDDYEANVLFGYNIVMETNKYAAR
jgi:hypothetical protein